MNLSKLVYKLDYKLVCGIAVLIVFTGTNIAHVSADSQNCTEGNTEENSNCLAEHRSCVKDVGEARNDCNDAAYHAWLERRRECCTNIGGKWDEDHWMCELEGGIKNPRAPEFVQCTSDAEERHKKETAQCQAEYYQGLGQCYRKLFYCLIECAQNSTVKNE